MPVIGFVEPWSVRGGGEVEVFVSSSDPHADVRVVSLDRDEKEDTGWIIERMKPQFDVGEYDLGSWIELPPAVAPTRSGWRLWFEFLLTRNDEAKCLCAAGSYSVTVGPGGELSVDDGASVTRLALVENERWYRLAIETDGRGVQVEVWYGESDRVGQARLPRALDGSGASIGSDCRHEAKSLNGRIGRIEVFAEAGTYEWRFPSRGPLASVPSRQDAGVGLTLHNLPTFSVASSRFTGEVHDPRLDPEQFDAVHLHDDDFAGFDWEPSLRVTVPAEARPGVFAVEVGTAHGVERLPFFVRARQPKAALAFLVPTSTYLAYADERLPPARYPWHGWDRGHQFAVDNGFLCLYDVHTDFTGVSLTSARRPRATLRDDYHYPLSDSGHLLSVDLQLLKFYARTGVEIDLLTDRDLNDEGVEAVTPYAGLLTGSHPEYWSTPMMQALDTFLLGGGNLAYLGGNGFYWVVAYQEQLMELRRIKSDIWNGRPGEGNLSTTGEPGGKWEDRGRHNPQSYLGVTYLIMSFGPSRPYRRLEGSYAADHAWLFDGVSDGPIGASGSVLGGAAGYEIDAVVRSEETPKSLVRLATADGFDASFQVRPELWLADGDAERETLRRADMTIYRHGGGGQVFCTGSVAWIGAVPGPGETNDVGVLMTNLARGFAARPASV